MSDHRPSRRLLLASRSPRRALLLEEAGFAFTRFDPPYADPADPNRAKDHPEEGAARALSLARAKAMSVPDRVLEPGGVPGAGPGGGAGVVLLTADTLGIDPDGQLIGTPETEAEASAMLRKLVGRSHRIATGVVLRTVDAEPTAFAEVATVHVGPVPEPDLERYVASGDWAGKAGGYNLAERCAAGWPLRVEGDPAAVMGLPMRRLVPRLERLGVERTEPAVPQGER
jgi:septum formation protein